MIDYIGQYRAGPNDAKAARARANDGRMEWSVWHETTGRLVSRIGVATTSATRKRQREEGRQFQGVQWAQLANLSRPSCPGGQCSMLGGAFAASQLAR